MSWNLLKTNYRDATWTGQKKYILSENEDGTYSIEDVTEYQNYDQSLFGASDANAINSAINAIRLAMDDDTMLPKATRDLLGGIKVGNYLTVTDDGVLSIDVNALAIGLKGGSSSTGSNPGSNTDVGDYVYLDDGSGGDIGRVERVSGEGTTSQTIYVQLARGMNAVQLKLYNGENITKANVDWGDGTSDTYDEPSPTTNKGFVHKYRRSGSYVIRVTDIASTNNNKRHHFEFGFGINNSDNSTGYRSNYTTYKFEWEPRIYNNGGNLHNSNRCYLAFKWCNDMRVIKGTGTIVSLGTSGGMGKIDIGEDSTTWGTYLTTCYDVPQTVCYLMFYTFLGSLVGDIQIN